MPTDDNVRYALRRLGVDLEPEKWTGVWIVMYLDASSVVTFGTEIEALRYAVDKQMFVKFVPYGEDIFNYKEPSS